MRAGGTILTRMADPTARLNADLGELADLTRRVVYFPVRHHSPAGAKLVRDAIDRVRPDAVLIEGPSDFNDRTGELMLPHRPPIAIYSYLLVRSPDPFVPDRRQGVYYPFCEHSPEWQAARHGHANGAKVSFIDLPWADLAGVEEPTPATPTNRYADRAAGGNPYVREVCNRLGVESFHDAWDTLFEIEPATELTDYLRRAHRLCATMRLVEGDATPGDAARELHMARHVRAALAEFNGPVLVVTGGYHSLGLLELLRQETLPQPGVSALQVEDRGIALTPYSFERLDSLTGYNAGMPNPGFYHQLWHAQARGETQVHKLLMREVVGKLRAKGQPVSSADLIAAEVTAQALAAVRGHARVWRTDWLDGLTASLIKDDTLPGVTHPILAAINEVLRGGERGQLAEGTLLPPLVADVRRQLEAHDLTPAVSGRDVKVDLADAAGRERSRVMHRVRTLEVPGFTLTNDVMAGRSRLEFVETWRLAWSPEFDASVIENSRYGATLVEAATAKLTERAAAAQRDAKAAAQLLFDAALAGLDSLTDELLTVVTQLVRTDGDFVNVSGALGRVLFLYHYDPVLGVTGRADVAGLLWETFDRSLWLLESLGQTRGLDAAIFDGVRDILDTFERCEAALGLNGDDLRDVFRRVAADRGQSPGVRGATLGGSWVLHDTDGDNVTARLQEFADPEHLGDFLAGLFALAREQAQRQRPLISAIHAVLNGFDLDQFLAALPALRLAFTFFTPREKHKLALTLRDLLGLAGAPDTAALAVSAETAMRALVLEDRLNTLAKTYGLRGFDS